MKRAVLYQRISDKDQSNSSLKGQLEINTFYARTVDAEVIASFEDNGASGKNFQRKGWKNCETFLRKHKGKVDYLIVWKYDRFGRNLSESLAMIEKIELRWNIKILASAEPIYLSPTDPYFFKERASRLLDAHFERLRISDRAKMGNWMAKQQGRFIGRAPFGFLNIKNSNNKPDIG
jgi:DNA invertase Pin-like site-specific DNA recombinase